MLCGKPVINKSLWRQQFELSALAIVNFVLNTVCVSLNFSHLKAAAKLQPSSYSWTHMLGCLRSCLSSVCRWPHGFWRGRRGGGDLWKVFEFQELLPKQWRAPVEKFRTSFYTVILKVFKLTTNTVGETGKTLNGDIWVRDCTCLIGSPSASRLAG